MARGLGRERRGECDSAVVPYIRPKAKTGKVYLYYKCLAQTNGLPVRYAVTSIEAQKLEEFVIYKLPVEQQIRTLRLLVDRVLLFKDKVRVELHELPIPDLQRALDINTGGARPKVQIPTTSKGGGQKTTAVGTAVIELEPNWRRGRDSNPREALGP